MQLYEGPHLPLINVHRFLDPTVLRNHRVLIRASVIELRLSCRTTQTQETGWFL